MVGTKELELQFVSNLAGHRVAVIIPIAKFEQLVEDIEDLAAIAENRVESTVKHKTLIAELKRDGLL